MLVTRRRFFAGSAAIAVAGAVIAKSGLPRLLPSPNKPAIPSPWTIGLIGEDGKELNVPGYERRLLASIEGDGYFDLQPIDGAKQIVWIFPGVVTVGGWALFMPGFSSPTKVSREHFPQTIVGGVLTLDLSRTDYVARVS
jgi:hypothetical protein